MFMRRVLSGVALLCAFVVGGAVGHADEPKPVRVVVDKDKQDLEAEQAETERADKPSEKDYVVDEHLDAVDTGPRFSRRGRGGARLGMAQPIGFGVRYAGSTPCEPRQHGRLCTPHLPLALDGELSLGITHTLEVLAAVRWGVLEQDLTASRPLRLSLGYRSYGSAERRITMFSGLRVLLDLTREASEDPKLDEWKRYDLGARVEWGLQFEIVRQLGLYLAIGGEVMLVRSLLFSADLAAGLQVRFP